jgi:hypothetical protein
MSAAGDSQYYWSSTRGQPDGRWSSPTRLAPPEGNPSRWAANLPDDVIMVWDEDGCLSAELADERLEPIAEIRLSTAECPAVAVEPAAARRHSVDT